MNPTPLNSPDQAAAWALRLGEGPLTTEEERALSVWLAKDPAHESSLQENLAVYEQLTAIVPSMVQAGELPDYGARCTMVRPPLALFRRLGMAAAVAAAIAVAAVWWVRRPEMLSTPAAHRQSLVLADGTKLDLNARTSLSVSLHGEERRIELTEGEAYFQVAKDGRPFFVQTPAGTVRVTGTEFNVRADTPGSLEVTVLEGSVAVAAGQGEHALRPNQQLSVAGAQVASHELTPISARNVIAWRDGRLNFESERLDVAVARFAHYHGRRIQLDPSLAALEIGGRFRLDDLDGFLAGIEISLPVQTARAADGAVRIVPR